jgi:hypothetical protein
MICVLFEGRLTQQEYLVFRPQLESTIRHYEGLRLVFVMDDELRWEPRSMWRKLRFDSRHRTSVARLAVVGGSEAWRKWLLTACQHLDVQEAMSFSSIEKSLAWSWAGARMSTPERRV